ncbi:hypothetical protein EV1_002128 [Malus domestica]|uniref:uncharacterized protein LOC126625022 n=1 Tax=Malus sylvestris TaxID=3752 RepID=UPI0021ACBFDC|nr:uncharacterized protein LOC126625022 [Malus sylvestris]
MFFIPSTPFLDSAFDVATLLFISALIVLSLLSISFIFNLCLKSRTALHLRHFNSLWTVRFLLVIFIIFWSLNELLRIPTLRRTYLYPFLSVLASFEEPQFCKIHVALSLGLFEPAFLVTLLFLVDASTERKTPNVSWAIAFVLATCLPMLLVQVLFLFFHPFHKLHLPLPEIFVRNYVVQKVEYGSSMVSCTYPLLNTIMFAAFGGAYSMWFLFSCWRVLSLVINKGLRLRIYTLAATVLVPLPLQIILMGMTVLWKPDHPAFTALSFAAFLSTLICAAVGQGILVIKPIADSLAAGEDRCRLIRKRKPAEGVQIIVSAD